MITKKRGLCQNYHKCINADNKISVEVFILMDFICPECGQELSPAKNKFNFSISKPIYVIIPVAVLLISIFAVIAFNILNNHDPKNSFDDFTVVKTNSSNIKGSGSGTGKATGSGIGSATSSNKDGSGTGQGNEGTGIVKDKSGNDGSYGVGTGGPGTGVFDSSGNGIFGRKPVTRPKLSELNLGISGKMVFKICIDKRGESTFVDFISNESTINDKKAIKKAIDYLSRFVWETDYSVEKELCGKYTVIIQNRTE